MRWPRGVTGLCYGGDYNPEQWPEAVWEQDVALMREAGVNLVSLGVFAWSRLEPDRGRYDFEWLDRVLDLLHAGGVSVALATPTASPPPWFSLAHPEALPVTPDGVRLTHGSRDTYCASAPAYRDACVRIATELGSRYARHPGLAMWHVHNEYGTACHCHIAAAAFRRWLRDRYGTLEALNDAWCTGFWSQRYSSWDQIRPPRATRYLPNPTQDLDFRRFTSDELLAAHTEQRDVLRAISPDVPITTNFHFGGWVPVDQWRWSSELDLIAVDHYPDDPGPAAEEQTALVADLSRGLAAGGPWLLMESAPNLIYTRGRMHTKEPGRLARHSLAHVARGSRGAMFFQWRAPAGGAERFTAALVPHAGPDSRVFREAVALGDALRAVAEADTGTVRAEAAIVWDAESWWALQGPGMPATVDYLAEVRAAHRALWRCGITTDVIPPAGCSGTRPGGDAPGGDAPGGGSDGGDASGGDASGGGGSDGGDASGGRRSTYRLIVLPALYLMPDATAAALRAFVADGGHVLVTPLSGMADEHARVRLGGYPGALRDVLGIRVEEFHPLPEDAPVELSTGARGRGWAETVHLAGATAVAAYTGGIVAGRPAITRHRFGAGLAWYVSTRLADEAYAALVAEVASMAGVSPVLAGAPAGVEVVRRRAGGASWLFLLNHTGEPVEVPASGVDLVAGVDLLASGDPLAGVDLGAGTDSLAGGACGGPVRLAPGAVTVLREQPPA